MIKAKTKDGKEYSNPKDVQVPEELCLIIYEFIMKG